MTKEGAFASEKDMTAVRSVRACASPAVKRGGCVYVRKGRGSGQDYVCVLLLWLKVCLFTLEKGVVVVTIVCACASPTLKRGGCLR